MNGINRYDIEHVTALHHQLIYPTVRVRAGDDGGSGTVLYSSKQEGGEVVSMVMTNHHVVESIIEHKKKYDYSVGRDMRKEYRGTVGVEFFKYNNLSRCIGSFSVEASVVAYDDEEDMALLQLRDVENQVADVANIYPIGKIKEVHTTDPIYAVGASLGHPPIQTFGEIVYMDDEIENKRYWMVTAPSIFGISGGAIYRWSNPRSRWEYIGIPSRIEATLVGWSVAPVPHMAYVIPIDRVIKFLDDKCYQFIYDSSYTIEECNDMRAKDLEKKRMQLVAEMGAVVHKKE